MKRAAWLPAAAILLGSLRAPACPCRGSAGPSAPLTSQTEHWGVALTQSTEVVHGVWDPYGELRELGADEHNTLIDVALLGAYRPLARLELAAQASYSRHSVVAPGLSADGSGSGDALLRARWDAIDQPMPLHSSPLPGLALALALRVPTGDQGTDVSGVTSGSTGSVGSSAASTTLGAWELALGVELSKSYGAHWAATLYGEGAYRLPDDTLGIDRQLGPRALGQVGVRYIPAAGVSIGAFSDVGWESEIAFDGERLNGTAQRRVSVGAYTSWRLSPSGLRGGISLRHSPLLDELSANALASTSLAVSLGVAR